jgi:DNA-binding response OmpR family regulator
VQSARVLVVDDEPMVCEVVTAYLQRDGATVLVARDGVEAAAILEREPVDLVVLDVMLPGIDGLSLLRTVRSLGDTPVVLLTARGDELDRVLGLQLGADDYVVKPFSPRELAARVQSVLRRTKAADRGSPAADNVPLRFGRLCLEVSSRTVTVDDRELALTAKEFDLLALLARSPRRVFSRRQLLEIVWNSSPDYQDPATVTVHVGRLRQKLDPVHGQPPWITTVRGVGYRFEP